MDLFSFSLEKVLLGANVIYLLAVGAAAIASFVIYFSASRLTAVKDAELRRFQSESARAIAEANEKVEEARLEQEKLKRDNLELEKLLLPRELSFSPELIEQLTHFAGTPVMVWSVPDFEARRFADRLGELLQLADWQVERDDKLPLSLFGSALPDNVIIITRSDAPSPKSEQETAAMNTRLSAADMVLGIMKLSEVEANRIKRPDIPNLTRNGVCVIVGVKSASAIVMRRIREKWEERLQQRKAQDQ